MKKLITFLLLCVTSLSYAGFEKRNGGDGVWCKSPDKPEHYLRTLDFYESQIGLGPKMAIQYELVPHFGTDDELIAVLEGSNKKFYPNVFQNLHIEGALFFYKNSVALAKPFENVDDSNEMFYFPAAQRCQRVQLAVNQWPLFKNQKIFYINILFGDLSKVDQHRLILHELLTFCSSSQTTEQIRYLSNLLLSDELLNYTEDELDKIFKQIGIKYGLYNFKQCFKDAKRF